MRQYNAPSRFFIAILYLRITTVRTHYGSLALAFRLPPHAAGAAFPRMELGSRSPRQPTCDNTSDISRLTVLATPDLRYDYVYDEDFPYVTAHYGYISQCYQPMIYPYNPYANRAISGRGECVGTYLLLHATLTVH